MQQTVSPRPVVQLSGFCAANRGLRSGGSYACGLKYLKNSQDWILSPKSWSIIFMGVIIQSIIPSHSTS